MDLRKNSPFCSENFSGHKKIFQIFVENKKVLGGKIKFAFFYAKKAGVCSGWPKCQELCGNALRTFGKWINEVYDVGKA